METVDPGLGIVTDECKTSFGQESSFDFTKETTVFAVGNIHADAVTEQLLDIICRAVARPLVIFHDRATNPRNNGMLLVQMSDECFVLKAMERLQGYQHMGLRWVPLCLSDSSLLVVLRMREDAAVANLKKSTVSVLVVESCVVDGALWVLKAKYWAVYLMQRRPHRDGNKAMTDLESYDRAVIKKVTMSNYQSFWRDSCGGEGEMADESFLRIVRVCNGSPFIGVPDADCWMISMC